MSGQQHVPAVFYLREKPGIHCTGGWVLGGSQCRSGRAENFAPPGFDPQTVQTVVSRYTELATRPTHNILKKKK